jgi:uncharacterized repeat protein (TIGR03806 family)
LRWLIAVALAACGDNLAEPCDVSNPDAAMCDRLSRYGVFDDIVEQTPADGVIAYDVNTPLFSDYTTKFRFMRLPDGTTATWSDTDALDLPVGTMLIKTFAYLHDRRDPSQGRDLLETRLLIHGRTGWHGAAYVYDDDNADASQQIAGTVIDASWIHDDGTPRTNRYVVPNKNQCKDCHAEKQEHQISPIGPKVRHINRDGQLENLIAAGKLVGAPDPATWPKAPDAFDPQTGTLDQRARAWLDINCSYCHNPNGLARTSGLFLDIAETEPAKYGQCKPPVATGRGSGGRAYDIIPGQPDASIMMYRIESTEPETKMPELGRNLVHTEGAQLIRDWITSLPGGC